MTVEHVEVLVEEPSMEALLRELLPRLLDEVTFEVYPYQCKDELLQRLPDRLRGYASWLPREWCIVVVVDRDDDDCHGLKQRLDAIARRAGLRVEARGASVCDVINRLAIEELEAWYFGDWTAVCSAYPRVDTSIRRRARYRDPDAVRGGTWEAFERILQRAGYFAGGLRKIEAARAVAVHMNAETNTSHSFQVLRSTLAAMAPP